MKPERAAGHDAGFTIIELLIVVTIEALIVTALGSAFVLVMNSSTTVNATINGLIPGQTPTLTIPTTLGWGMFSGWPPHGLLWRKCKI